MVLCIQRLALTKSKLIPKIQPYIINRLSTGIERIITDTTAKPANGRVPAFIIFFAKNAMSIICAEETAASKKLIEMYNDAVWHHLIILIGT